VAILDLTWQQIDFDKKLIDFGRGGGNKRRAIVPMNDGLYESLKIAKELAQTACVIEYHSKHVVSIKAAFRRLCNPTFLMQAKHALERRREKEPEPKRPVQSVNIRKLTI